MHIEVRGELIGAGFYHVDPEEEARRPSQKLYEKKAGGSHLLFTTEDAESTHICPLGQS